MSEVKPKSYRIDEETAGKLKNILEQLGGNQQEAFAKLVEAYEFQSGKAILTEKKADIEQFEKYINALTRMFMGSLEDNQNMKEIIQADFDALLKSKDAIIQDLQQQIIENNSYVEKCDREKNAAIDEKEFLQKKLDALEKDYQQKVDSLRITFSEKQTANDALTNSYNVLKEKCQKLEKEVEKNQELVKEFERLKNQENELKEKIFSLKEKYNNDMTELKEKHMAEIDAYQVKYKELLEKLEQKTEKPAKKPTTAKKKLETLENKN